MPRPSLMYFRRLPARETLAGLLDALVHANACDDITETVRLTAGLRALVEDRLIAEDGVLPGRCPCGDRCGCHQRHLGAGNCPACQCRFERAPFLMSYVSQSDALDGAPFLVNHASRSDTADGADEDAIDVTTVDDDMPIASATTDALPTSIADDNESTPPDADPSEDSAGGEFATLDFGETARDTASEPAATSDEDAPKPVDHLTADAGALVIDEVAPSIARSIPVQPAVLADVPEALGDTVLLDAAGSVDARESLPVEHDPNAPDDLDDAVATETNHASPERDALSIAPTADDPDLEQPAFEAAPQIDTHTLDEDHSFTAERMSEDFSSPLPPDSTDSAPATPEAAVDGPWTNAMPLPPAPMPAPTEQMALIDLDELQSESPSASTDRRADTPIVVPTQAPSPWARPAVDSTDMPVAPLHANDQRDNTPIPTRVAPPSPRSEENGATLDGGTPVAILVPPTAVRAPTHVNPFLRPDASRRMRQMARALASDIVTYHKDAVKRALASNDFATELGGEIRKSWEEFQKQAHRNANGPELFAEALNAIVADGRAAFSPSTFA